MTFINYKLYYDIGLVYPSTDSVDDGSMFFAPFKNIKSVVKEIENKEVKEDENSKNRIKTLKFDKILKKEEEIKGKEEKVVVEMEQEKKKLIFKGLTIFVSR
jgi:hypothetical protein